jgi:hypothetical protein
MQLNLKKFFASQPFSRVILIYMVMLVLCNLLVLGSAFFFKFNVYLIAIVVVLVAVMAAIFFNKKFSNPTLNLTKFVLGFSFSAVAAFFVALLIFIVHFMHPLTNWKLQEIAKLVSIDSVTETPYLFADTQVGLRVTANVRLLKEIALDQYGLAVVEALKTSMHITPQGPFEMHGYFASTIFDRLTFDELTTKIGYEGVVLSGTEKTYLSANDKVNLPAGVYQISKVFLLNGLYFLDRSQSENPKSTSSLCRNYALINFERPESKESYTKELNNIMQITASHPWAIKISGGMGNRVTGRHGFAKSSPLQYRYEHAGWQATLDSLSLPSCKTMEQDVKAMEQLKK